MKTLYCTGAVGVGWRWVVGALLHWGSGGGLGVGSRSFTALGQWGWVGGG